MVLRRSMSMIGSEVVGRGARSSRSVSVAAIQSSFLAAMLSLWIGLPILLGQAQPSKNPAFVVRRPMIVAFFSVTQRETDNDPDTDEALSDFQFYAGKVRGAFSERGIEFQEVYARSFRVISGGRTLTFRAGRGQAGYYLVAPARKPRIEYGVKTDADLLEIASKYFGPGAK